MLENLKQNIKKILNININQKEVKLLPDKKYTQIKVPPDQTAFYLYTGSHQYEIYCHDHKYLEKIVNKIFSTDSSKMIYIAKNDLLVITKIIGNSRADCETSNAIMVNRREITLIDFPTSLTKKSPPPELPKNITKKSKRRKRTYIPPYF